MQVEPRQVTNSGVVDTSLEMEDVLVEGYRDPPVVWTLRAALERVRYGPG